MNILQVGCHTGNDEHCDLVEKADSAVLIDANERCITEAKEKYKDFSHVSFEAIAVVPIDLGDAKIKLFHEEEKETSSWTSVNPDFVAAHCHHNNLKYFESDTTTLSKLLQKYPETDTLILDTEGLDFLNILSIDGELIDKIDTLIFEFIHCDGIVTKGPKLQSLLNYLTYVCFSDIKQDCYNLECKK